MYLKLATGIGILVAGPVLAFLLLFAGCEGQSPAFGVLCGHNMFASLIAFTFAAWFVLACGAAVVHSLYAKQ